MATTKFGKKAKKAGDKAQVPGPSAPLWLQTYGDFVTLVLTFFVMLLAQWKRLYLKIPQCNL